MQIQGHRLTGANVTFQPSPNCGGELQARYVIMHFTGGRSAASSAQWLCDPQAKASAHVVVARDGSAIQLVPFNTVAWHAGVSRWGNIVGLNGCSIGIEMDNMGELTHSGQQYLSWFKAAVPAQDVLPAAHKADGIPSFWHEYTEPQIATALELVQLLTGSYPIEDVLGHEDIAPGRKRDPGPAFPMASFKARVAGRQLDALPRFRVATDMLNIRSGPGIQYAPVAPPLRHDTIVLLEDRQTAWSRAIVESQPAVKGWVSNSYLAAA